MWGHLRRDLYLWGLVSNTLRLPREWWSTQDLHDFVYSDEAERLALTPAAPPCENVARATRVSIACCDRYAASSGLRQAGMLRQQLPRAAAVHTVPGPADEDTVGALLLLCFVGLRRVSMARPGCSMAGRAGSVL